MWVMVSTVGGSMGTAAPASAAEASRVVVVAVPGLRWGDVTATGTPHLWAFAGRAARGALSVKAVAARTTCAAGMLTLGAGNRAVSTPYAEATCTVPSVDVLPHFAWGAIRNANSDEHFGTQAGLLAETLAARGLGVVPVGAGAAMLASVRRDGTLSPTPATVTVVADTGIYGVPSSQRAAAVRAVDGRLGRWLDSADAGTVTLVVGAADSPAEPRALHVAMASGPGFAPGWLTSDSTGRSPYVQLIDVAPTVLHALRIATPDQMSGEWWRTGGGKQTVTDAVAQLRDRDEVAVERGRWGGRFVTTLVAIG